ncbi:nascent polypeptide-associated complex subunit alpha, muscle-specific form-like isoform X9 [Perognathus longimembris pacificus]|uniref:nascent polypeptide-associated complex subunit alpha, muscle-specific form-like isoform X9 n=1 Tax=Perognathus longimembris pacificus TaxID=214514 RepID=UPI00201A0261|nr:nascent polypeptide-associated complex subunit alpha, muscle-specific form-like isoform X9 [Perognathus longimembris pacificus]
MFFPPSLYLLFCFFPPAVLPMSSALNVTAALGQHGPSLSPPCPQPPQQCPVATANQPSPFPSSNTASTPFEVPFPQPSSGMSMETAPETPTFLPHLIGPPISPAALALASPMIGPSLKGAHSPSAPLSLVALAPHSIQKSSGFPSNPFSSLSPGTVAKSGSVTPLSAPIAPSEPKTSATQDPSQVILNPKGTTPNSPGIVSTIPSHLVTPLASVQSGLTSCAKTLPTSPLAITGPQVQTVPVSSVLTPQSMLSLSLKGPICAPAQKTMAPNIPPPSTTLGSPIAVHQSPLGSLLQPSGQRSPSTVSDHAVNTISIDSSSLQGASCLSQKCVISPLPSRKELVADTMIPLPVGVTASARAQSVDKDPSITTYNPSESPDNALSHTASLTLKGSSNTTCLQPLMTQIPASLGTGLKDASVSSVGTTPVVMTNTSMISVSPTAFEIATCVSSANSSGLISSKESASPANFILQPVVCNELPTQVPSTVEVPVSPLPASEDLKTTSLLANISPTQVGLPARKDPTLLPLALTSPKISPSLESTSSLEETPESTPAMKSLLGPLPVAKSADSTACLGITSPTSISKTSPKTIPGSTSLLLKSSITAPTVADFPLGSFDPARTTKVPSTPATTASLFLEEISLTPKKYTAKGTSADTTLSSVPPASESCPVALAPHNATMALTSEIPKSVHFPTLLPIEIAPTGAKKVDTSHMALAPLTSSPEGHPNDSVVSVTASSKGTLTGLGDSPSPVRTNVSSQAKILPSKKGSAVPAESLSSLPPLEASFLPEANLSSPGYKDSLNRHSSTPPSPKGSPTSSILIPLSPEGAIPLSKDIPTPSALLPPSLKKLSDTLSPKETLNSLAITPPFPQKVAAIPSPKGASISPTKISPFPQKTLAAMAPTPTAETPTSEGAPTALAEIPPCPPKTPETLPHKKAAAAKDTPETPLPKKTPATVAPKEASETPPPKRAPATTAPKEAPETSSPKRAPATAPKEAPETSSPKKAPATVTPKEAPETSSQKKASTTAAPKKAPEASSQKKEPAIAVRKETPETSSPQKAPSAAPKEATETSSQKKVPATAAPKEAPETSSPKKASATAAPKEAAETSSQKKAPATVAPKEAPETSSPKTATAAPKKAPEASSQKKEPATAIPKEASETSFPQKLPSAPKEAPETSPKKKAPGTTAPQKAPEASSPKKEPATAVPKETPETSSHKKAPGTASPKEAPETSSPKKAPATLAPKEAPETSPPKKAQATAAPKEAPETSSPKKAPATAAPKETPPHKKVPATAAPKETPPHKKAPATAAPKETPETPPHKKVAPKEAPETSPPKKVPGTAAPQKAPEASFPQKVPSALKEAPEAPPHKKAPLTVAPKEASETLFHKKGPATVVPKEAPETSPPKKAPGTKAPEASSPKKEPGTAAPKEAPETPPPTKAPGTAAPKEAPETPPPKKAKVTAPKRASGTPTQKKVPATTPKETPETALPKASATTTPKETPETPPRKRAPASAVPKETPEISSSKKAPKALSPKRAPAAAAPKEAPETPPQNKAPAAASQEDTAAPKEAPEAPSSKKAPATAAPKMESETLSPKKASEMSSSKKIATPNKASETLPPKKVPASATPKEAEEIPPPKRAPEVLASHKKALATAAPKEAPEVSAPKVASISPPETLPYLEKASATLPTKGVPIEMSPHKASATAAPKGISSDPIMTPSQQKARATAAPQETSASIKGTPTAPVVTPPSPKEAPASPSPQGTPTVQAGTPSPLKTLSHKEAASSESSILSAIAPPLPKGSPIPPKSVTCTMGDAALQASEELLTKKGPISLKGGVPFGPAPESAAGITAPAQKGSGGAKKNSTSPPKCSDPSTKNETKEPLSAVAPASQVTVPVQKDSSKTAKTYPICPAKGKDSLDPPKGPLSASSETSTLPAAVAPKNVLPKAGSTSVSPEPTPQVPLSLAPSPVPPLLPKQPFLPSSPGLVLELPSKPPAPADEDELPPLIPPEPVSGGVPFQPILVNMPTPKPAGIPAPTPSAKQPVLKNNKGICLGLPCAWCVAHTPLGATHQY